jgi:hypothetical protein
MLPLIALSLLTTALAQTVPVTIINQCATPVQPQLLGTNNGIANPATLAPGGTVSLNIYDSFTGFIAASTGDGSSVYGGASLIYVNLNVGLFVQCAHIVLTSFLVRKLLARKSHTPDAVTIVSDPLLVFRTRIQRRPSHRPQLPRSKSLPSHLHPLPSLT